MKVLVIPDVHLKPRMFEKADGILKNDKTIDKAVSLGDLPDDWKCKNRSGLYDETFDAAEKFLKDHTDTIWIKGNHECSYIYNEWQNKMAYHAKKTAEIRIDDLYRKVSSNGTGPFFAYRIDRVIFSHAGIVKAFVEKQKKYKPDAVDDWNDIDKVIDFTNTLGKADMWGYVSPVWSRPQAEFRFGDTQEMYGIPGETIQVVGHTPVKEITEETDKNGVKLISCDTFSLDHNKRPMGNGTFLVIDTKTGEWEAVIGRD